MRRLLISTFAIVCALASWAATRAEYAYGLKATQDGDNATFTFSVTGAVMDSRIILTSSSNGSSIEIPVGAINAAGTKAVEYNMSGLAGDYTWKVEVTTEAIPNSKRILDVPDSRSSVYRGGVVCISDPQADSFGYTVIGMGMGKGFTVYDPVGNKVSTTIPASTVCNASHKQSPYRGGELDGMAVFADYSDAYSAYHVFDPLNPSTTPKNLLAAEGFQRYTSSPPSGYTSGIWANSDKTVITGGNATCAAFYKDAQGTHLITLGEDINPANSLVRYTLDANGKISSAPDKDYTDATTLLGATRDCDVIAIENGFFVCDLSASTNSATYPTFFYCDYDGNVLAKSSDITQLAGSYSGIAINASRNLLAVVGYGTSSTSSNTTASANRLYIYKITWNDNVPSFEEVNALGIPTATNALSWACLRFDPADNLWAYYDHYGYVLYGLQNTSPQSHTTPAKTGNTVSGTLANGSGLRALAYDLSYKTENYLYYFTYSLSADAKSVVFKFTDPDDGSIKHEIQVADEHTTKGEHTVELDLNQLAKGKDYLWTIEVEAYPSGEYAQLATFDTTTSAHGSVIPVTEPNSMWFGYTLTASGNNGQFILYNPALGVHSNGSPNRFGNIFGSPYRGTFHNGYAYVANNDAATSGIYKVDLSDLGNVNLIFGGDRNITTGAFTFTDATTASGRTSCVAFQGTGVNTKLYTFDVKAEKPNCYTIGESDKITTAPTVLTYSGITWPNYNCDIITTKDGYFVSQSRSEGNNLAANPGFIYCNNANTVLYNSGDHTDIIPSCNSGIALNAQEDRFAVCRYGKGVVIDIFKITWTDGTPALTKLGEIPVPNTTWSQLRFDAAGNLHAYLAYAPLVNGVSTYSSSCYNVYSIVYPAATTTTCCPTKIAGGVSGVDIIQVGPAVDETPRFFNLQGVEVSADNLTPGIYIRVCNGTSTKVQVK